MEYIWECIHMNISYRDQWEILQSINLTDGEHKSIDCPFCGGRKKFSISKIDGKTLWNCYRASCNAKGVNSGPRSIEEAKAYLAGKNKTTIERKTTPIPEMTTSIENYPKAVDYLKSVNSYEAYKNGCITVRYAPGEDRVLFYTQTREGAVGRTLRGYGPKWWTYGDTKQGIHVGVGSTAVLVEDAASACSISRINNLVGVALLGTNLTKHLNKSLKKYSKAIIILDNDAKEKAVSMLRGVTIPCSMRITKLDIKCLKSEEVERIVKYYD